MIMVEILRSIFRVREVLILEMPRILRLGEGVIPRILLDNRKV